jgi:hypothetical protein
MAKDDRGNTRIFMYIAIDNLISARTWMENPEDISKINELIQEAEKLKRKLPVAQVTK